MSVEELFQENREILSLTENPINIAAFNEFAKNHSDEQALGYLAAIADFKDIIEGILYLETPGRWSPYTGHMVKKNLTEFHWQLFSALKDIQAGSVPLEICKPL